MNQPGAHWALLIGIDFYPREPLRGCVNDVRLVKAYLGASGTPMTITALTATPSTKSGDSPLVEDRSLWPTLSNIRNSLEHILELSNPGDLVYIHYSGHGRRFLTPSHLNYGHKNTGDVGLVVLDDSATTHEELRGMALANILKRMVQKGLLVTLILDCCFSGHIYRQSDGAGGTVRSLGIEFDSTTTLDDATGSEDEDQRLTRSHRDARALPNWMIDPEGYTIITACGPHETAEEVALNGKMHGVLSFYLHRALADLALQKAQVSHQSLYNHLVTMVRIQWPRQTPMRYGSINFSFFKEIRPGLTTKHVPIASSDQQLILKAGFAHGVCEGDDVYPFGTPENSNVLARARWRTKVSCVGLFTSKLELVDTLLTSLSTIAQGCKARLVTHCSPKQTLIGLTPSINKPSDWISSSQGRPFFRIIEKPSGGQQCNFFVERCQDQEYQILDADYTPVPSLPPVSFTGNNSLTLFMDILQHLATFSYFESIQSPVLNFEFSKSFNLGFHDSNGVSYETRGIIDVPEQEELTLTIQNLSKGQTLYVTVINFTPSWQIQYLSGEPGGPGFDTVPPKDPAGHCTGHAAVPFEMVVPEYLRPSGQCEDVVKVLVTNVPTSFHSLLMPRITSAIGSIARGNDMSRQVPTVPTMYIPQWSPLSDEKLVTFKFTIRTHC